MWWNRTHNYTDDEIIDAFRTSNNQILKAVYDVNYKPIEDYILNNGGRREDVKDVFQDGLSIIYQKVQQVDFTISSSFSSLLYQICKNLWLYELRKKRYSPEFLVDLKDDVLESMTEDERLDIVKSMKERLFYKHLKTLDETCQKLILHQGQKGSMKDLADKLGFKSELDASHRKGKCKEMLIRRIKSDPDYNSIYT